MQRQRGEKLALLLGRDHAKCSSAGAPPRLLQRQVRGSRPRREPGDRLARTEADRSAKPDVLRGGHQRASHRAVVPDQRFQPRYVEVDESGRRLLDARRHRGCRLACRLGRGPLPLGRRLAREQARTHRARLRQRLPCSDAVGRWRRPEHMRAPAEIASRLDHGERLGAELRLRAQGGDERKVGNPEAGDLHRPPSSRLERQMDGQRR